MRLVYPKLASMSYDSVALRKSYEFALNCIHLYKTLSKKNEFTLGRQLLRSGTSIGANMEEAIGGFSRNDFLWKISIAYKEAREAHYWLRLLRDSKILSTKEMSQTLTDADELIRIIGAIKKTTQNKQLG